MFYCFPEGSDAVLDTHGLVAVPVLMLTSLLLRVTGNRLGTGVVHARHSRLFPPVLPRLVIL